VNTVAFISGQRLWTVVLGATFAIASFQISRGDDQQVVRGRIMNTKGEPVESAVISDFWSANGPRKKADGSRYDLSVKSEIVDYWSHEGVMAPYSRSVKTDVNGRFSIQIRSSRAAIMAIGPGGTTGCTILIPRGYQGEDMHGVLGPLFTFEGHYKTTDGLSDNCWCHSYVCTEGPENRPLANKRLISCGSFSGEFAFRLPAGRYKLRSYGSTDGGETLDLVEKAPRDIEVPADRSDSRRTLSAVELVGAAPSSEQIESNARREGRWVDLDERYGATTPNWHTSFASGVSSTASVGDFRGKWVFVAFWGFGCPPCLSRTLPSLAAFHKSNKSKLEHFEIIAVCIDPEAEIIDAEDLNERLSPFVTHLWNCEEIPFPIIVDSSHRTWTNFGLRELGTTVIITPEGKLMKGDLEVFGEKLSGVGHDKSNTH